MEKEVINDTNLQVRKRKSEEKLRSMKKRKLTGNIVGLFVSLLIVCISLFPVFWMLISCFKTKREAATGVFWPTKFSFDAFSQLDAVFFNSVLMTFIGALISVTLCVIINLCAAYAFARINFHAKKLVWALILVPMFVPGMTILVPLFLLCSKLGILDTLTVLIIPGVAQAGHIFFMRQFFLNVPSSLEEAALIDGADRFQVFIHVFVPLSFGPLVIVALGAFMGYWNAYLWPVLTIERDSLKQIMQIVQSYKPSHDPNWPLIMAASTIATAIPLTIYFIFNKKIVESLKISGIK